MCHMTVHSQVLNCVSLGGGGCIVIVLCGVLCVCLCRVSVVFNVCVRVFRLCRVSWVFNVVCVCRIGRVSWVFNVVCVSSAE